MFCYRYCTNTNIIIITIIIVIMLLLLLFDIALFLSSVPSVAISFHKYLFMIAISCRCRDTHVCNDCAFLPCYSIKFYQRSKIRKCSECISYIIQLFQLKSFHFGCSSQNNLGTFFMHFIQGTHTYLRMTSATFLPLRVNI